MTVDNIWKARKDLGALVTAIRLCHAALLTRPALVLLYAGIDIAGWLADAGNPAPARDRDSFLAWVEKYLRPRETFAVTPDELFGARCGLIHRGDATSRLSEKGVRTISYGQDAKQAELLNRILTKGGWGDTKVAISVADLIEAFERGVSAFFAELDGDAVRRASVNERAASYFQDVDPELAAKFLAFLPAAEG